MDVIVPVQADSEGALRDEEARVLDMAVELRAFAGLRVTALLLTGDTATAIGARARGADRVITDTDDPVLDTGVLLSTPPSAALLPPRTEYLPRLTQVTALAPTPDGIQVVREEGAWRETLLLQNGPALLITGTTTRFPRLLSVAEILRAAALQDTLDAPRPAAPVRPRAARAPCVFLDSVDALADVIRRAAPPRADPEPALPPQIQRRARQVVARRRPPLERARVVVIGGRALREGERFDALIGRLADTLGGAVGASGGATAAGYTDSRALVGQSGVQLAPQLVIVIGVSGVDQQSGGWEGAQTVVAVNADPHAPIFGKADFGLVGDLFTVVPDLIDRLCRGSNT